LRQPTPWRSLTTTGKPARTAGNVLLVTTPEFVDDSAIHWTICRQDYPAGQSSDLACLPLVLPTAGGQVYAGADPCLST